MYYEADEEIDAEIDRKTSDIERKIAESKIPAHEIKMFKMLVATSRMYLKKKTKAKRKKQGNK